MMLFMQGSGSCALSPDGKFVATGSEDSSQICIFNIATQAKVYTVESGSAVRASTISFVLTM